MRDELLKKLDKITDLDDRKMLKAVLINAFDAIVEHNMNMYETLRTNIYNEIQDPFEKYYIYTTVDSINNIDPISTFYYPMIDEDNLSNEINFENLISSLNSSKETVLTTVFMELDYSTLENLIAEKRYYKCIITTENEIYHTKAYLSKSKKYLNKVEELYRVFQFNEKDWKTVNYGYAHKFVDVIVDEVIDIDIKDKIKEITIDLGEYESYKRLNYIMFWNVKNIKLDDQSFPKPLENTVHYEHSLNIDKGSGDCGYLVNTTHENIKYVKQTEDNVIIANEDDKQGVWDIVKIENINRNIRKNVVEYEDLSNKQILGFVGRFANEKSLIVRTPGELARIFQSYELSKELSFDRVEIVENYDKEIKTTDLNYFLDNNLRNDPKRNFMVLKFETENREDFLLYEKLSFFISVAGLLFPEYKCVGEII